MDRLAICVTRAVLCAAVLFLAACGGGGGGGSSGPAPGPTSTLGAISSGSQTYSATAGIGEFLTYSINFDALTYSYTIVDSAFGLAGRTGSGTLVRNSDGTYTPTGYPPAEAKVLALNNGLLLGAIRENFGSGTVTVPIIGVSNPISTLSDAAGIYNFVEYVCQGACQSVWGTFQIRADGTWQSCRFENFSSTCTSPSSGTLSSLGNGKWLVSQAGFGVIGAGLMLRSSFSSQKVTILDLHIPTVRGFLVGSEQMAVATNDYEGKTWVSEFFSPGRSTAYSFTTGTDALGAYAQTVGSSSKTRLAVNSPFAGFVTTDAGEHAIVAGVGVFAATGHVGLTPFAEFGIIKP